MLRRMILMMLLASGFAMSGVSGMEGKNNELQEIISCLCEPFEKAVVNGCFTDVEEISKAFSLDREGQFDKEECRKFCDNSVVATSFVKNLRHFLQIDMNLLKNISVVSPFHFFCKALFLADDRQLYFLNKTLLLFRAISIEVEGEGNKIENSTKLETIINAKLPCELTKKDGSVIIEKAFQGLPLQICRKNFMQKNGMKPFFNMSSFNYYLKRGKVLAGDARVEGSFFPGVCTSPSSDDAALHLQAIIHNLAICGAKG